MEININQEKIGKRILALKDEPLAMIENSPQEKFKKILKKLKKFNCENEHYNLYTKDGEHYLVYYRFNIKNFSILRKDIYIEYYYRNVKYQNVYAIGEELYNY